MHQFGGRTAAEGVGVEVEHLHALRDHFVKTDAGRELAAAEVLGDEAEVVAGAVGLDFGGEGVDEVEEGVDGEDGERKTVELGLGSRAG